MSPSPPQPQPPRSDAALAAEVQALAARLRMAEDRLERTQAELNQLAYAASHDLRQPLRSIDGFLNLLVRRYGDGLDDTGRHYIERVKGAAGRLDQMIDHLVEYSRIETRASPCEAVAGDAVLEQALARLEDAIRQTGARIATEPLPELFGDRAQLVRLFEQLIANGLIYQPAGGVPIIRIAGHVERDDSTGAAQTRLAFRDNGIGIGPEHHARVFQVFQRLHTEAEYPGPGMGLALCRRIVERHQGRIWIEASEPGQGAVFAVTLPTAAACPSPAAGPDVPAAL